MMWMWRLPYLLRWALDFRERNLVIDQDGWLQGRGVVHVPAHPSWFYDQLLTATGCPLGIMAHYTATDHGTARSMARRRTTPRGQRRAASWHVTVDHKGTLWQMVPFHAGAWHCGRGRLTDIDDSYVRINHAAVGVELEGHGDHFPKAQVEGACRLWAALVTRYDIRRDYAMLQHSRFDPQRRRDPGPVWMDVHAPVVLDRAFPARVG